MSKLRFLLSHLTLILALMFLVFLILDQFNPLMNFIDNSVSQLLLALFCASAFAQSVLYWAATGKEK